MFLSCLSEEFCFVYFICSDVNWSCDQWQEGISVSERPSGQHELVSEGMFYNHWTEAEDFAASLRHTQLDLWRCSVTLRWKRWHLGAHAPAVAFPLDYFKLKCVARLMMQSRDPGPCACFSVSMLSACIEDGDMLLTGNKCSWMWWLTAGDVKHHSNLKGC